MGKRWTDQEIDKLILYSRTKSLEELSQMLGRPIGGIIYMLRNQKDVKRQLMNCQQIANFLGVKRYAVRKWMVTGVLGPFRENRSHGRKYRYMLRSDVICFVGDPINAWKLEMYSSRLEDLREYMVDKYDWYVDLNWIHSHISYISPQAISNWFDRKLLPCMRLPYSLGGPHKGIYITPRKIAEKWIELYNDGMYPRQCSREVYKLNESLVGFDIHLAHNRPCWGCKSIEQTKRLWRSKNVSRKLG